MLLKTYLYKVLKYYGAHRIMKISKTKSLVKNYDF